MDGSGVFALAVKVAEVGKNSWAGSDCKAAAEVERKCMPNKHVEIESGLGSWSHGTCERARKRPPRRLLT